MYADSRERFPDLYKYEHTEEELHRLPIKVLVGQKDMYRPDREGANPGQEFTEDPRVTWIGRLLRRSSLDELPNFINVLRGDMHLVGPRPDIFENILYYPEHHLKKLNVRPGITGLAQIMGRGRLSFYKTNELDVEYVRRRSLLLDLKILLKTIPAALWGKGAV
jgi:lipopolysaccharide/colanic/teichoic acid biosynthesis glycosyltransferase